MADPTPPPVSQETERWRPSPLHDGTIEVSDQGRVRSLKKDGTWKIRGLSVNTKGYMYVQIWHRRIPLHRLVALTWIPGEGKVVRHLNDQKLDNRLSNLAWGSHLDNYQDAVRNGRMAAFLEKVGGGLPSQTHCPRGHSYEQYGMPVGKKITTLRCAECKRAYMREYASKKRQALKAKKQANNS